MPTPEIKMMDNNPPLQTQIEPSNSSSVPHPMHLTILDSVLYQSHDPTKNMELDIIDLIKFIEAWKGEELSTFVEHYVNILSHDYF